MLSNPDSQLIPSFTYIGGKLMKRRLKSVIEHFYPQVNARTIFQSSNSIENFFKFKDRVPLSLASSVVYQYTCRQCSATYIGESKKQ